MILKLLLVVIVGVLIYRLLGGRFPPLRRGGVEKRGDEDSFGKSVSPTNSCIECGTYVTESDAIIFKGRTYCSKECLDRGL
ncbi:MAG: hypothetical protein GXO06_04110 [Epsilonproteobacteria bacterium]|nr:hypothetical protein [Campylobacterota bacterium]